MGLAFKELSLRNKSQKYRGYYEWMIPKQNNKVWFEEVQGAMEAVSSGTHTWDQGRHPGR